jgi:tetratricopeptide (TPR) repeat protein
MSVGDYDGASALYEESLKCRQAIGEPRGAAYMMTNVATFERLDDRQLLAWTLSVEGLLASAAGRSGEAFSCFERSVALCRLVDSMLGLALALAFDAEVALGRGDRQRSSRDLEEALPLFRRIGMRWGCGPRSRAAGAAGRR